MALALVAVAFVCWEGHWRARAVEPSYDMDLELWCDARRELAPDGVALLGTSRIRSAVRPETLAELLDAPVVLLAINGSSPVPILEDLAADPSFRGLAIVDVIPRAVFDRTGTPEAIARQFLDTCAKSASPFRRAESTFQTWIHEHVVSRHPKLTIVPLLASLANLRMPDAPHYRVERSGFLRQDFGEVARASERAGGGRAADEVPVDPAKRNEIIARVAAAVAAIRQRSGRVILLRMPSSGGVRSYEETVFPRTRYWDALVAGTTAPAIHYQDVASLSGFSCPDGSHLDFRDSERFTRALASVIRRPAEAGKSGQSPSDAVIGEGADG